MKRMKRIETIQGDAFTDDDIDPRIMGAELHNLQQRQPECEWIELADAVCGHAHVARMLIRQGQERRSTQVRPNKINEEQLQCIALFPNTRSPTARSSFVEIGPVLPSRPGTAVTTPAKSAPGSGTLPPT